MKELSPSWQSIVHALILHPTEPALLMVSGQNGWVLPSFHFAFRLGFGDVTSVLQAVHRTLSADITAVRWTHVSSTQEDTHHRMDLVLTCECTNPCWVPPDGIQWIGRQTVDQLPLALPEQRKVMASCLREEETALLPLLRPAWERRGWLQHVRPWLLAQLEQLGYSALAPIEPLRVWGISCIVRVPTTVGMLYFKAGPAPPASLHKTFPFFFANEAALVNKLATWYPEHIPSPLALEEHQGWMLLADFGSPLRAQPVPALWQEALLAYSRIQLASISQGEQLLQSGFPDRRLDKVAEHLELLVGDPVALSYLETMEAEQLRASVPLLKTMCQQLTSYALPPTLVHGDLHPGNVAFQHGKLVFFDWADGGLSHPFLDAATFWGAAESLTPRVRDQLRHAYLAQWQTYETEEHLIEAAHLAEVLALLYQVLRNRDILAHMQAPWDAVMGYWVAFWTRRLLVALATYHDEQETH